MGRHTKAIVTMALGDEFLGIWKRLCEPNWRVYADRHGFDLISLDRPLDTSERARARSAAWQKCLILSQPFADDYERIVWIDADILINNRTAPDISAGISLDRLGAVEDASYSSVDPAASRTALDRAYQMWPEGIVNFTPQDYYTNYGLPGDCDRAINTGVMVLSPRHHRALLEHVYYGYEEKGGREWHMEMRPLSYEAITSGTVEWIDPRFNVNWFFMKLLYYPYLVELPANRPTTLRARLEKRARGLVRTPLTRRMEIAAVNAVFHLSYFLHVGGPNMALMALVNEQAEWCTPSF